MSVPYGQRWRLLATFNGGFIYRDGQNGSTINGTEYEPLKDGLATLVAYRDGRVDIHTWTGGPVADPQIAFARQSLPLIVDKGRLNPALNDSSQWGFTLGNAVRVWRTGAGVDRHEQPDLRGCGRIRRSSRLRGSFSTPVRCARCSSTSTRSGRP